jgi:nucleoside-diphosphate-sugar epimerase
MEAELTKRRVLITGGAGAIGSRLAHRLVQYDCRVQIVDDLSSGRVENLPSQVELHQCDISGISEGIDPAMDYVIHCAAFFANANSILFPERDLEVNGLGTLRLMQWVRKSNTVKGIVYLSSSCVYGAQSGQMREETVGEFGTPYVITKYLGERYCRYFYCQYRLPVVIVRLFNSYGPGEFPGRFRNVVPNFMAKAMAGHPLSITGTGNETRDYTYVEDIVDGILSALVSRYHGEVFNLGTGIETPIRRVAETINAVTGNRAGITYLPKREWDHISARCAYIEKARKALGFQPKTALEDGIGRTYDWFRTWWKDDC